MVCEAHSALQIKVDKIDEKQDTIAEDIAIIKSYLIGNGRPGIIKRVDQHDKYLYMISGGMGLIGFVAASIKFFQ